MGNSILSCFCVIYCSSYLEHSSLPSPCSKSTARSSTSASLWTKPPPPPTHTHTPPRFPAAAVGTHLTHLPWQGWPPDSWLHSGPHCRPRVEATLPLACSRPWLSVTGASGQLWGWRWVEDSWWPGQNFLGLPSLPLNPQFLFPSLRGRAAGGLGGSPRFSLLPPCFLRADTP